MSQKVAIRHAVYLGGLPGDRGGYKGNFWANDDGLGMGISSPKKGLVLWEEIAGISFDSGTAAKSRAGKALLVGVFALAAKNTQSQATITVTRNDGNVALFQVNGVTGAAVRAKVQPFLIEHSVKCLDDAPIAEITQPAVPQAPAPAAEADPAEQLKKLADLHQSGLITDEEFAAKRAVIVDKL
jgi:hypothetical protein